MRNMRTSTLLLIILETCHLIDCDIYDEWSPRTRCADGEIFDYPDRCLKKCAPVVSPTVNQLCFTDGRTVSCEEEMMHRTVMEFSCKPFHVPGNSPPRITCYDGVWNDVIPSCEPECGKQPDELSNSFVGETEPPRHVLPWAVAIYSLLVNFENYEYICGGTIISNTIVISAAQCFWDEESATLNSHTNYQIVAGKYFKTFDSKEDLQFKTNVQRIGLKEIHVPDLYGGNTQNQQADVAILKLINVIEFSRYILPACLTFRDESFERYQLTPGTLGKMASWIKKQVGDITSDAVKEIDLPVMQYTECRSKIAQSLVKYLTADKICVGQSNGTRECQSDNGAGVVFSTQIRGTEIWYLRGIVSVGKKRPMTQSCRNGTYSIVTKISSHGEWIMKTIDKLRMT